MKKKSYVYLAIAVFAVIAAYYGWTKTHSNQNQTQYRTEAATQGTLVTSVSASGNVVVNTSASIDPDITGTVASLAVQVGDQVKSGQPLFTIVNDQLGVSVSQAQSSYQSATSSLISAQTGITSAKASEKDTQKSTTSNHQDKLAASAKVTSARASVTSAGESLASASADLAYAQQQAAKRNVTSPINGTVNVVNVKNGDDLSRITGSGSNAQAAIVIGDMSTLKAQVQVNEVDISNVKIGQPVTLTFDALPGFTATGKVETMDSLGTVSSGVVTFNVTVGFDHLDSKIKPGMSVTAAIITSTQQDVVMVPLGAVKTVNGQSSVTVLKNGQPQQVSVQTGASNDTDIVITSGVSTGDQVVTQTITPGSAATSTTSSSSSGRSGGATRGGGGGGLRIFGG
ncbi:MAG: efflux RND transporter periplasmic adaptor subunit [Candidatus Pacebacteria bacterium]|nr:efflux RND transporter periplasmic adaptor subunit [Candidatus Paceibacterota bacterium]MDR3583197.1 efflux RND transporter periplasmic adaptor subunit [Candidatus Paceibacterota bacterium]